MFLWEEDAKPREEATVLCNSRSEPQPATSTTPRAGARRSSPPPPYTSVTGPSHVGVNQADVDTEDEEEETFPWPLTGAEEAEITRRADRISPPPVTPKKPNTSNAYPTPTTGKRKISNVEDVEYPDLTTPHTTRKVDERLDNTAPRFDASSRTIGATPQTTPTPSRFKDALAGPESFDLTGEVFAILQNHNVRLNNETQDALRSLLNRSDLRIQGIMKGRDVSRLQIKAKDARIAEQVHRISTLEAELEAEKAMVQHMRWERQSGAGPD